MITRRPDSQPLNSMQDTHNRINPINRSLNHPTTTTTSNVVNTISRNQVNVNTIPAQQSILNSSNSGVIQGRVNTSNRSRNLPPHMQQNHQNSPQQSAGLENQGSNPNN